MMATRISLIFILLIAHVAVQQGLAQEKKILTPADYHLWDESEKMSSQELSQDGQWLVFKTLLNNRENKLYLWSAKNMQRTEFTVSPGTDAFTDRGLTMFSADSKWLGYRTGDTAMLIDMKNMERRSFPGMQTVRFTANPSRVILCSKKNDLLQFNFIDPKRQGKVSVAAVKKFSFNPDASLVVLEIKKEDNSAELVYIDLLAKDVMPVTILKTTDSLALFAWNDPGNAIGIISMKKYDTAGTAKHLVHKLFLQTFKAGKMATHETTVYNKPGISPDGIINTSTRFNVDSKGENIYLSMWMPGKTAEDTDPRLSKNVDIRKSTDNEIVYHVRSRPVPMELKWNIVSGDLSILNEKNLPEMILLEKKGKALLYDKEKYKPRVKYLNNYADMYIKDLNTGKSKLFLEKIIYFSFPEFVSVSPSHSFISYFRNHHWWLYNVSDESTICLTKDYGTRFADLACNEVGEKPSFESPVWLEADNKILLFDEYDVYEFSLNGKTSNRLSKGREQNLEFRYMQPNIFHRARAIQGVAPADLSCLLFFAKNRSNYCDAIWKYDLKNGMEKLVEEKGRISLGHMICHAGTMFYNVASYDLPPQLKTVSLSSGKNDLVFQMYPHHFNFDFGRKQMVHYKDKDGYPLNGALIYPAGYDAARKYPMIVEIYEMYSRKIHVYEPPTNNLHFMQSMLNPAYYAAEGYLILRPDIKARINDPGVSANECVQAALDAALKVASIDPDKIGLMGHSYGGYETGFIISQSNRFKAAIAGAGIFDMTSYRFTISKSFGINLDRAETGQHRMAGVPFYGDAYKRNNTFEHLLNINTPIFLWTGTEDKNVDAYQTIEMHAALWRLGKSSTLVTYTGDDHVLLKPGNFQDFHVRMKQWWDYYLKDGKLQPWMTDMK